MKLSISTLAVALTLVTVTLAAPVPTDGGIVQVARAEEHVVTAEEYGKVIQAAMKANPSWNEKQAEAAIIQAYNVPPPPDYKGAGSTTPVSKPTRDENSKSSDTPVPGAKPNDPDAKPKPVTPPPVNQGKSTARKAKVLHPKPKSREEFHQRMVDTWQFHANMVDRWEKYHGSKRTQADGNSSGQGEDDL